MEDLTQQKALLRHNLRKLRREQLKEVLLKDSRAICDRLLALPELSRATTVFCYVSCGGEVETHGLLCKLLQQGKTVVVPRCKENGQMDCVPIEALSDLLPGKYGILEPPAALRGIPEHKIDFSVIPAIACGKDGSRLGQGGGYYDRFLCKTTAPFAALCTEAFLLDTVPREPHDQRMKIIVTPQQVLRFEEV